jgi:hypothetical protein
MEGELGSTWSAVKLLKHEIKFAKFKNRLCVQFLTRRQIGRLLANELELTLPTAINKYSNVRSSKSGGILPTRHKASGGVSALNGEFSTLPARLPPCTTKFHKLSVAPSTPPPPASQTTFAASQSATLVCNGQASFHSLLHSTRHHYSTQVVSVRHGGKTYNKR